MATQARAYKVWFGCTVAAALVALMLVLFLISEGARCSAAHYYVSFGNLVRAFRFRYDKWPLSISELEQAVKAEELEPGAHCAEIFRELRRARRFRVVEMTRDRYTYEIVYPVFFGVGEDTFRMTTTYSPEFGSPAAEQCLR